MKNVRSFFVTSGLFVLLVGFISLEQPLLHTAYAMKNSFLPSIVDPDDQPIEARIVVNGFEILADVAITDEDQTKGLSIKDHMNENEGMLFAYDKPSQQSFWMKDMRFPIDIIWLNCGRICSKASGQDWNGRRFQPRITRQVASNIVAYRVINLQTIEFLRGPYLLSQCDRYLFHSPF